RLTDDLDPQERGPQDACGVFGVWGPGEEVAKLTYFGLYALQHRGQEAAGIAVSDGASVVVYKDLGLVSQVFDEPTLGSLRGHLAVGHTRYSTTGASTWENAQPTFRTTEAGTGLALCHNGNLVNTAELAGTAADAGRPGACPDTTIGGRSVHAARVEIGRRLAKEHPADADLVIPVPESGTPAAVGYAEASGIPYGLGLVKNSYVGRTFIQPSQTIRQLGIRL